MLVLLVMAVFGWNYWLPMAQDFFNHVTPANENRPSDLQNIDFHAYYSAGQRFRSGSDPYSWGKDAQGNPLVSDYIYPPTLLPVFGLIARLSYNQARTLWLVLYALAYLLVLGRMTLAFEKGKRFLFLSLAILLTLASFPLLDHILTGQADIFVICLILGSFLTYRAGGRIPAAVLLALATVLKVSPVFLLIYFVLFLRDWRFLIWYAGAVLLLLAASLLVVPFSYYTNYIFQTLPEVSKGTAAYLNQSLLRYLSFSPGFARLISFGGLACLAVLMAVIGKRYSPAERQPARVLGGDNFPSELAFILNLGWTLIFVGKAWPATYVWLILPSAWLVTGLLAHRAKPAVLAVVILAVFLVTAKNYGYPFLESLNLCGNLLLSGCLLAGLLRKGSLIPLPGAPSESPL